MDPRTQIADVTRLYEQAEAEHDLVEIELDTTLLRAISAEEAEAIIAAADLEPTPSSDMHMIYNPQVAESLEALLKLCKPAGQA